MRFFLNLLKYLLPILISGLLLWYAFQKVSLSELLDSFQRADYQWIIVSAILGVLSHISRAMRWQMLINPLGYSTKLFPTFLAVMIGYFMNFVIPRAGELARCGVMQRLEKVPADKALGTVVIERLTDVLMLGILTFILLLVEFNRLSTLFWEFLSSKFGNLGYLLLLGFILLIISGLLILFFWKKIQSLPFFPRFQQILQNVWLGVQSIRQVKNLPLFVFHTLFIWAMYYAMAYSLFFCFPETRHLDLWFGYIVLIMGTIGMATPVQGGFGAYHLLVGNIFAIRGLTAQQGIILATFMHTVQTVIILIVGGICFLIFGLMMNKIDHRRQTTDPKN